MSKVVNSLYLGLIIVIFPMIGLHCSAGDVEYRFGELKVYSFQAGMCRAYLIKDMSRGYLIDAGSPGQCENILRHMKAYGIDSLALIILTHGHFDHYGSAADLRDSTGAPIAIHEADSVWAARAQTPLPKIKTWGILGKMLLPLAQRVYRPKPTKADVILTDKQSLKPYGLHATIMHTPGHTPGSITIMVQDSIAFAGDLISARPTNHVQRYYAFDWDQVRESFHRLQNMKPAWTFPGHGTPPLSARDIQELKPRY